MLASSSVLKTAGMLVIVVLTFPVLVFYDCCFSTLKSYVITCRQAIAFSLVVMYFRI